MKFIKNQWTIEMKKNTKNRNNKMEGLSGRDDS